ncbi:rCG63603 [Rattus norvegicus]|uniref:RCG63603 n=1 Tax=Rattus norvegicus TaxID=10116 RepID=A6JL51_RAT|nr:rCG63603 [Rattus norvegicus]
MHSRIVSSRKESSKKKKLKFCYIMKSIGNKHNYSRSWQRRKKYKELLEFIDKSGYMGNMFVVFCVTTLAVKTKI